MSTEAPEVLYVPVHRNGTRALPFNSMTAASLFVIGQGQPQDWKVELIYANEIAN